MHFIQFFIQISQKHKFSDLILFAKKTKCSEIILQLDILNNKIYGYEDIFYRRFSN